MTRRSIMSWFFMCLCLLFWDTSSSNPLGLENSNTDSRNDEKWLRALPYMEYLLEDPNYRPMISVTPTSVRQRPFHRLHVTFRHPGLLEPADKFQLLIRTRGNPNVLPYRLCQTSSPTCRGRRQEGIVGNPLPHLFTLDINPGTLQATDMLKLELSGMSVSHKVKVVSLVLVKRRHDVSTRRRLKRAARRSRSGARGRGDRGPNCRLHEWNVTVSQLGWGGIIAPKAFQPNYCAGGCPIDEGNIISNNARIRRLYNRETGKRLGQKVPSPCCVPLTVKKLEVIYLNNGTTLTYKMFDDVIATDCACL